MVVQLSLQAAALREAGMDVVGAAVQFTEHKARVDVAIGPDQLAEAARHDAPRPPQW
jgi:hypothetical protein